MATDRESKQDTLTDSLRDQTTDVGPETATADSSKASPEDDSESVVLTVLELLGKVCDEDPTTMHPPLANVIDPEILICLQQSDSTTTQELTFEYQGHTVTVTNRGTVCVTQ